MEYDEIELLYGTQSSILLQNTHKYCTRSNIESTFDVYTNIVQVSGVFDIIHGGHIAYLQEAKEFGETLVVTINTDASAERYKGHAPYLNLFHRAFILTSIDVVDFVTTFDEDDPSKIISIISPNVYVKGYDTIIDSSTPELKELFKTSALRLTSEEKHVDFHTTHVLEKLHGQEKPFTPN